MFQQSQNVTFNRAFADAIAAAFGTVPGGPLIATPHIHLYTNNIAPTPDDTLATYTEANFTGYAAGAPTLSGAVNLSPNVQGALASSLFLATAGSPFVPNTIYGYYVSSGTNLVASEKFAAPIAIANPGDFLQLDCAFPVLVYQSTT